MLLNEKVEIEYDGNIFVGKITNVINKGACVVSWNYKKGKNLFQHNKLFMKDELKEVKGSRI